LLALLEEPEYEQAVAEVMVEILVPPKPAGFIGHKTDYGKIWETRARNSGDVVQSERGKTYATALQARIAALLAERACVTKTRSYEYRLMRLATALASIDSRGSSSLVLEVLSVGGPWDEWQQADGLEKLLFNGVPLPIVPTMKIIESALQHVRARLYSNQEIWLMMRFLCILPFLDNPSMGIQKVREEVSTLKFIPYELRDVVTAIGHSRCDEALDFLVEVASAGDRAQHVMDVWVDSVASLDIPDARKLLLSFLDPEIDGRNLELKIVDPDRLAPRIVNLARRESDIERHLFALCDMQLPSERRMLLTKVIAGIGTQEAILAGLNLIEDNLTPSVPYEIGRQIEEVFVERRPEGKSQNSYTLAPRSSNAIRARLLEMAEHDDRRRNSATSLLVQIEAWRLEYGRPNDEPRNPAFDSAEIWPPVLVPRRAE
jgi:hypothetical protein